MSSSEWEGRDTFNLPPSSTEVYLQQTKYDFRPSATDLHDRNMPAPTDKAGQGRSRSAHSSAQQDVIAIKNLQLPFGVIAPDVWGKPKEQPALVSVHLLLRYGFDTAAGMDALDGSTIHYGEVAKRIRAKCHPNQTAGSVSAHVEEVVQDMAGREVGRFLVSRLTIEVKLEKASMFGDGITLVQLVTYDNEGRTRRSQRIFHIEKCRLMVLIGLNPYERAGKQPLEASVWLHLPNEASTAGSSQMVTLFNLDQTIAQIIQESSFGTLETLANFTVSQLRKRLLDQMLPGGTVHLKLEKPRAIPFADAPCVEVLREIPKLSDTRPSSRAVGNYEPRRNTDTPNAMRSHRTTDSSYTRDSTRTTDSPYPMDGPRYSDSPRSASRQMTDSPNLADGPRIMDSPRMTPRIQHLPPIIDSPRERTNGVQLYDPPPRLSDFPPTPSSPRRRPMSPSTSSAQQETFVQRPRNGSLANSTPTDSSRPMSPPGEGERKSPSRLQEVLPEINVVRPFDETPRTSMGSRQQT